MVSDARARNPSSSLAATSFVSSADMAATASFFLYFIHSPLPLPSKFYVLELGKLVTIEGSCRLCGSAQIFFLYDGACQIHVEGGHIW